MSWLELALVLSAAAATDFALLRWQASATAGRLWATPLWSVIVAGLGYVGLAGAFSSASGIIAYLAGNAIGSWLAAYLSQRTRT